MKTKIALIIGTLALIISLSFLVYALLETTEQTPNLDYNVGEFKVSVSGEFREGLIIPGVNLVKEEFKIKNESTINIDIRVKIEITLNGSIFNDFKDINGSNGFDFRLNELSSDGFYYLDNIAPSNSSITLFTKMILDGYKVQSAVSNKEFKVELIIHAKQEKHATWEDLGSKFIN